jgi:hypothetical protein
MGSINKRRGTIVDTEVKKDNFDLAAEVSTRAAKDDELSFKLYRFL